MKIRDLLERVLWTGVAGVGGGLVGAPLLDYATWKGAVVGGLTAVINAVSVIARWRLSVLPDPGAGLPGLPTG